MITAEIKINGRRIHYLSAVNKGKIKGTTVSDGWRKYKLGCGCILEHDRNLGALCLLIQMAEHAQRCPKLKEISRF